MLKFRANIILTPFQLERLNKRKTCSRVQGDLRRQQSYHEAIFKKTEKIIDFCNVSILTVVESLVPS